MSSDHLPGGVRHWVHEIHRRSIWQVLSVYLMGSWGALQVVEGITENAGLPDWVPPFALVLLVIGLPVVLATAVVQKGLPGDDGEALPAPAATANLASGTGSLDLRSTRPGFLARHLTWRRALFGGMGSFSLLGVAVGGYFVMRGYGVGPVASLVAQGVLDARDPVVLAEFSNASGDEALGELVTEALRVDLLASPVLTVVEPTYVAQVLQRMESDPGDGLSASLAREVAIREGFKAVIEGEVGSVGTGYLLTARIVAADAGTTLAAFRRSAADQTELLDAIDGLSQDIREKAGESLRSIKGGEALGTVTTSSLDALRLYSRALATAERGDRVRAIELLEEAVAADSTFAMAWRKLAVLRGNLGRPRAQQDAAAARAWRLRERLSVRERLAAEAYYHQQVTGNLDEAERAYRSLLDVFPDDNVALNNLSLIYSDRDEHGRALALLERAVRGPGESGTAHGNLVATLAALGRDEEALAAADRYAERYPADPSVTETRASVHYRRGRLAEARAVLLAGLGKGMPANDVQLVHSLAGVAAMGGALDEAEARLREMVELDTLQVVHAVLDLMRMDIVVRRDPRRALAWPERARDEPPFRRYAPESWDADVSVLMPALAGRADLARSAMEVALRELPEDAPRAEVDARVAEVRGHLARASGDPERAVELFRESRSLLRCRHCLLPDEGFALAEAGRTEEAVEVLQGWLDSDDASSIRAFYQGAVLEGLGALYEERGNAVAALEAWSRFADLFAGADPELQSRVRAARERIAALGG